MAELNAALRAEPKNDDSHADSRCHLPTSTNADGLDDDLDNKHDAEVYFTLKHGCSMFPDADS